MTPHTLTLLGPGHYRAPLRPVGGTATHCHEITLLDETGQLRNAYLKVFDGGSKGVANEAAGWLISRARGIDTPPRAWIVLMRVSDLMQLFDVEWGCAEDELWPCWATQSIEGVPLDHPDAGMWSARLACWPRLAEAIAVHEWLQHKDANAGNIIAVDLDQFTVVDHADILGGEDWTPKKLKALSNAWLDNKLLHMAWHGLPCPEQATSVHRAAERHGDTLEQVRETLERWWGLLLEPKEVRAGMKFLHQRAHPTFMTRRI